jgi:hypothetical protein
MCSGYGRHAAVCAEHMGSLLRPATPCCTTLNRPCSSTLVDVVCHAYDAYMQVHFQLQADPGHLCWLPDCVRPHLHCRPQGEAGSEVLQVTWSLLQCVQPTARVAWTPTCCPCPALTCSGPCVLDRVWSYLAFGKRTLSFWEWKTRKDRGSSSMQNLFVPSINACTIPTLLVPADWCCPCDCGHPLCGHLPPAS